MYTYVQIVYISCIQIVYIIDVQFFLHTSSMSVKLKRKKKSGAGFTEVLGNSQQHPHFWLPPQMVSAVISGGVSPKAM